MSISKKAFIWVTDSICTISDDNVSPLILQYNIQIFNVHQEQTSNHFSLRHNIES